MIRSLTHLFGKEISRQFYPLKGSSAVELPEQTLVIHYYENKPTVQDALAGTGKIGDGTQVSQNENDPYQFAYTLPAIDDPDPESLDDSAIYWESIKYITEPAGQEQIIIRSFKLSRLEELDSIPGTTVDDVKQAWPDIEQYVDDGEINGYLSLAETEIKLFLRKQGLKWERLFDLQDIKIAIAYRVVAESAASQIQAQNDKHHLRYEQFRDKAKKLMEYVVLGYDANKDGQPSMQVNTTAPKYIIARR
jgi:hypothetical protein